MPESITPDLKIVIHATFPGQSEAEVRAAIEPGMDGLRGIAANEMANGLTGITSSVHLQVNPQGGDLYELFPRVTMTGEGDDNPALDGIQNATMNRLQAELRRLITDAGGTRTVEHIHRPHPR